MKVRELVERLEQVDPELDVVCYSEDEALLASGHIFRLLEISGVDTTEAEPVRGADEVPSLKLGKGPGSVRLAVIEVTSDF